MTGDFSHLIGRKATLTHYRQHHGYETLKGTIEEHATEFGCRFQLEGSDAFYFLPSTPFMWRKMGLDVQLTD